MADLKPATDAEMDAIRAGLPYIAFLFSPAHQVMMLIARIDAERAARERAEARVKDMEEALSNAVTRLAEYENVDVLRQSLTMPLRYVLAAALKEPSNG